MTVIVVVVIPSLMAALLNVTLMGRTPVAVIVTGMESVVTQLSTALVLTV